MTPQRREALLEIGLVLVVLMWGGTSAYASFHRDGLANQFNQAVTASEFCAAATATRFALHAEAKPEDVTQCEEANQRRNNYRKAAGY